MFRIIDPHYAQAKLSEAIYELARGPGDVRSRLGTAYRKFHPVTSDDFPTHLVEDYEWIKTELTKYKCPSYLKKSVYNEQPDVDYTLSKIRNQTGVAIAERIIGLESKLRSFSSK